MADKQFKIIIPGQDGAGDQVFQYDNQQELEEIFKTTQANATSLIRKQAQDIVDLKHTPPATPAAPANPSGEREQFWNQMYANPEEAILKIIEKRLGTTLDEFTQDYQQTRAGSQKAIVNEVAAQFSQLHPELLAVSREDDQHNGKIISEILTENDWKWNIKNLEAAYAVAKSQGKLKLPETQQYPEAALIPSPTTITRPTGAVNTSESEQDFLTNAPLAKVKEYLEKKYAGARG